jgi:dUTP pyrophosphatase
MAKIKVKIKRENTDIELPKYETSGAAGFDIRASEDMTILGSSRATIKTGLFFEIPEGYEIQIRSRSGLAAKKGLAVLNSPGTIDSDYRGEVKIILNNTEKNNYHVSKGDRIAQGVLKEVPIAEWEEIDTLSSTSRGEGGYGSTGVN